MTEKANTAWQKAVEKSLDQLKGQTFELLQKNSSESITREQFKAWIALHSKIYASDSGDREDLIVGAQPPSQGTN